MKMLAFSMKNFDLCCLANGHFDFIPNFDSRNLKIIYFITYTEKFSFAKIYSWYHEIRISSTRTRILKYMDKFSYRRFKQEFGASLHSTNLFSQVINQNEDDTKNPICKVKLVELLILFEIIV